MFNFLRKNQDSKKVLVTEKEADGFILLDKIINEEINNSTDKTSVAGPECIQTSQTNSDNRLQLTETVTEVGKEKNQHIESTSMVELLSDVPFTLAPHVLAVQDTCNDLPRQLLSCDVTDNLTRFWYDFTLENSVLCES